MKLISRRSMVSSCSLFACLVLEIMTNRVYSQTYPYVAVDLGAFPETGPRSAEAINNHGQVTGVCYDVNYGAYGNRGFLWDPDRYMQSLFPMMDVGLFAGGTWSLPYDINDRGKVAGWAEWIAGVQARAFIFEDLDGDFEWDAGEIDELGIAFVHSRANALNESGNAVGYTYTQSEFPQVVSSFIYWKATDTFQVLPWAGESNTQPQGINEQNEFVGWSDSHAFIWLPQPAYGLSAGFNALTCDQCDFLFPDSTGDVANDINDAGQVVGASALPYDWHPFRWNAGQGVEDLGVLPGQDRGVANAINNKGDVVGVSDGPSSNVGWLHKDGVLYSLNDLISPSQGWFIAWPNDINDSGQIVGWGWRAGFDGPRMFLLTPATAPMISGAVSRKTHGAQGDYDIELELSGTPSVEPRQGGPTRVIITFSEQVYASDGVPDVSLSSGTVTGIELADNRVLIVDLSGVTDQSCLTMTLTDIQNLAGNAPAQNTIRILALEADVNANGEVNGTDVNLVKAHSANPVNESTFVYDIFTDGVISAADIGFVKLRVGHAASCQ